MAAHTPEPILTVDTREPSPEHDPPSALFVPCVRRKGELWNLDTVRAKLDAGDYSVAGLESLVTIERKSLADLVSTLFGTTANALGEAASSLDRFRAELDRMRSYAYRRIVVEASIADVFKYAAGEIVSVRGERDLMPIHPDARPEPKRWNPHAVVSMLAAIDTDYDCPTIWAVNRSGAELWVGTTLARIHEQSIGGDAWKKAEARGYAGALAWGPPAAVAAYRAPFAAGPADVVGCE